MKRIQLIAAAFCLVMLTTTGAGVVTGKQTENQRQAGASSIYTYNVAATDAHGTGKLIVNVDKHTFVFNGKDFTPSKTYHLRYTVAGIAGVHTFASAVATRAGTLHVEGPWMIDLRVLQTTPTITASTSPAVAVIGVTYGSEYTDGHQYYLNALHSWSSAGVIVRYVLVETPYVNEIDQRPTTLYDGSNAHLSPTAQGCPIFIPNSGFTMIKEALTVYDSAGNSDTTEVVWYPSS